MNNECDPQVGWKDHHTWHGRPYYAAWVVKSIWMHFDEMINKLDCNYALLGNDNGFIGSWGNRTLLARFGSGEWIEEGQSKHSQNKAWQQKNFTTPPFSMVKKPVLNAVNLLGLLGTELLFAERLPIKSGTGLKNDLNIMATHSSDGSYTVLLYNHKDELFCSDQQPIQIFLENFPHEKVKVIHYRIDENHGNPFKLWEKAGAPKYPEPHLLKLMRTVHEPMLLKEPEVLEIRQNRLAIKVVLPMYSVSLIQLIPDLNLKHPEISKISINEYTGINSKSEYLLSWETDEFSNQSVFEIYYTDHLDHAPEKLDHPRITASAHLVDKTGYYQVRTCDAWDRKGLFSPLIHVKSN